MNPDTGEMMNFDEIFKQGRDKEHWIPFEEGELIQIKGCFFIVNNFVVDRSFMNLKLITKEETGKKLLAQLP